MTLIASGSRTGSPSPPIPHPRSFTGPLLLAPMGRGFDDLSPTARPKPRSRDVTDHGRRLSTETESAFKTTEFIAYVVVLAGILIAGAVTRAGTNSAGVHRGGGVRRPPSVAVHDDLAVESGKRKTAKFRWACNKRLRSALETLAMSTRQPATAHHRHHPHSVGAPARRPCHSADGRRRRHPLGGPKGRARSA